MAYSKEIIDLFKKVRENEQSELRTTERSVRKAFSTMAIAYKDDKTWAKSKKRKEVDYNDGALRCAYLHKYAMVHAGLVSDILDSSCRVYSIKEVLENQDPLKLCCLGGGPGSEIVGLFLVLDDLVRRKSDEQLRFFDVTMVDVSKQWEGVFDQVVAELKDTCSNLRLKEHFQHQYLQADLLEWPGVNPAVRRAVSDADLITMVKFVSAAATSETECMIEKIFRSMKPGALVLFIDNAGGGFRQVVLRASARAGHLKPLYQDKCYSYNEENFRLPLFGVNSQSRATVCVDIWQRLSAVIFTECLVVPQSSNHNDMWNQTMELLKDVERCFDVVHKPEWVQTESLAVSDEEEWNEHSDPPTHLNSEGVQVMKTYEIDNQLIEQSNSNDFVDNLLCAQSKSLVGDDEDILMMNAQIDANCNLPNQLNSEKNVQVVKFGNGERSEINVGEDTDQSTNYYLPNQLNSEKSIQVMKSGSGESSEISDGEGTDQSTNHYPPNHLSVRGVPVIKTGPKGRSEVTDVDEQMMDHYQSENLSNEEEKQASICCRCLIM